MQAITDEFMQQMLMQTKEYTLVLLKANPAYGKDGAQKLVWEHGRRNFQLRAEGVLNIVAPVTQESAVAGVAIFNADVEKTKEIMDGDPAVQDGLFTYEILTIRSFPGDSLSA